MKKIFPLLALAVFLSGCSLFTINVDRPVAPTVVENPPVVPGVCSDIQRMAGNGYSFCPPADHDVSRYENPDGSSNFMMTSVSAKDTITITQHLNSSTYTDSDNKFGDVTVAYDPKSKKWKATGECDSPNPASCNRTFTTQNELQVFIGRSRWLTYIVPVWTNQILVFNSTGGGFTKPLEDLIQTLKIEN